MKADDVLAELHLDRNEPAPSFFPSGPSKPLNTLEYVNPIRQRMWGFGWSDDWWEFHFVGEGVVAHELSGFLGYHEVPWAFLKSDLRKVTSYIPTALNGHGLLLPVQE